MTYQEFYNKNKVNEQNYKRAVQQGQLDPTRIDVNPYMRSSIEKVDMKMGNGTVEIASKLQNVHTTEFVHRIVSMIMNSNCVHVTNPAKIKGWRVFKTQ